MGSLNKFPHGTASNQPPMWQNKLIFHKQIHLPSMPQQDKREKCSFPWTESQIASFISWHCHTLSSSFGFLTCTKVPGNSACSSSSESICIQLREPKILASATKGLEAGGSPPTLRFWEAHKLLTGGPHQRLALYLCSEPLYASVSPPEELG